MLKALNSQLKNAQRKKGAAEAMIRHKDILTEDKVPEKLGEEEVKTCVGFLVPVAISQLAASEADTAEASLKVSFKTA